MAANACWISRKIATGEKGMRELFTAFSLRYLRINKKTPQINAAISNKPIKPNKNDQIKDETEDDDCGVAMTVAGATYSPAGDAACAVAGAAAPPVTTVVLPWLPVSALPIIEPTTAPPMDDMKVEPADGATGAGAAYAGA